MQIKEGLYFHSSKLATRFESNAANIAKVLVKALLNLNMFGFFPLGLCRRQPRNRQIHRQVCWKRHRMSGVVAKQRNIGFVGFPGNVEQKWCRKYRKWWCCEIFVTKSELKTSLAVWRNLLPYIFQGWLQPGSPSTGAAPVTKHTWGWEIDESNLKIMNQSSFQPKRERKREKQQLSQHQIFRQNTSESLLKHQSWC